MSDYQAIYDAVRSRISGCDVGSVVADAVRQAFDISMTVAVVSQEFSIAGYEMRRPFMLLRPKIYPDGNQWCALYGDNIQDGVCGFGETPEKAAQAFDLAWRNDLANP